MTEKDILEILQIPIHLGLMTTRLELRKRMDALDEILEGFSCTDYSNEDKMAEMSGKVADAFAEIDTCRNVVMQAIGAAVVIGDIPTLIKDVTEQEAKSED